MNIIGDKFCFQDEDFIWFGERKVERQQILKIDKSRGLSFYVSVLMNTVFSKVELSTKSLTGKTSNFQKAAGTKSVKEALDTDTKNSVIGKC